jgi:hypothetical protein
VTRAKITMSFRFDKTEVDALHLATKAAVMMTSGHVLITVSVTDFGAARRIFYVSSAKNNEVATDVFACACLLQA